MSIKTKVPVSEELVTAFTNAKSSNIRLFKVIINNEQFQLAHSEVASGTASIDFKKVAPLLTPTDPCIILYREKDFGLPAPWILIDFVPDESPVNLRMLYASSKASLKEALGRNLFGKNKEFSTIDEVQWKNVQLSDLLTNVDPKPWSQREISIQELDTQESISRKEYVSNPPTQPSGFQTIKLPLTSNAEQALNKLKSKEINWVQLTLNDKFDTIDSVTTKTVRENELSENIDFSTPQFYIYELTGNVILIYCCPDEGTNIRNRMVYSTCKSSLAESIRLMGITVVKKFDIRTKDEVNIENLRNETSRKVALRFTPTKEMLRGTSNFEEKNSNIKSRLSKQMEPQQGGVQTAFRIMTGDGSPKLPKGVVLPPPGAYC